ncbi:hypothetical protein GA0061100_102608 [Rhizobium hainanense]|uniref:Uncharacterized protein n=1 Tax=Rhizobium hainanense TaxID=52131 RepID=A0A1C3ULY8_9HYPH|nr:hypothetical protein GA0061100_102608 [Rhizobium hainanense]
MAQSLNGLIRSKSGENIDGCSLAAAYALEKEIAAVIIHLVP